MLILHGSDLQIGKPYLPAVAAAFLALAREVGPDLVVVAGDLTQRAKATEYREARSFLDALSPLPVVVTPGNHDVPLFRVWERILAPYRNWKRFIRPDLDTVLRLPAAVVVALNSSSPRRAIVGGRIHGHQLDFARRAFAEAETGVARIVVTHHHFVPTPDGLGGRPLPGAQATLAALEAMDVDLVLGGHVHRTHLTSSRDLVEGEGPGIPLVACGTTASTRGRGPERDVNSCNLVRLGAGVVEVEVHRFDPAAGAFVPREALRLSRRGALAGPGGGAA